MITKLGASSERTRLGHTTILSVCIVFICSVVCLDKYIINLLPLPCDQIPEIYIYPWKCRLPLSIRVFHSFVCLFVRFSLIFYCFFFVSISSLVSFVEPKNIGHFSIFKSSMLLRYIWSVLPPTFVCVILFGMLVCITLQYYLCHLLYKIIFYFLDTFYRTIYLSISMYLFSNEIDARQIQQKRIVRAKTSEQFVKSSSASSAHFQRICTKISSNINSI